MDEAMKRVEEIQDICTRQKKQLVLYLSMAFGNPYGDPWDPEIVLQWAEKMFNLGITTISLADTVGVAEPLIISSLFKNLIPHFPTVEFGAHFHTTPDTWREKVEAAFYNGCRRFDGAIKGYGGCPMAKDELTGNMATENLVVFMDEKGINLKLSKEAFQHSLMIADSIFIPASHVS